jgi:acyl dehydratase
MTTTVARPSVRASRWFTCSPMMALWGLVDLAGATSVEGGVGERYGACSRRWVKVVRQNTP